MTIVENLLLITGTMFALEFCHARQNSKNESQRLLDEKLPPGYTLTTNGKEYKFVTPRGTVEPFSNSSRQEAIHAAVELEAALQKDRTDKWVPVK